ncbi:hypothetical protein ACVIU7_000698 [Bradyrhizobium liaoningense]
MVRLPHLWHGDRAGVQQGLLRRRQSRARHHRGLRHLRRRISGAAARSCDLWPLRRPGRPQGDARDHDHGDGHRHLPDRPASDLPADRHCRAGAADRIALSPGYRPRRRMGRRRADGGRELPDASPRPARQHGAGRQPHRQSRRDRHVRAGGEPAGERLHDLRLAHPLPDLDPPGRRRSLHPPQHGGDRRLPSGPGQEGSRKPATARDLQAPPPAVLHRGRPEDLRDRLCQHRRRVCDVLCHRQSSPSYS